MKRTPKTSRDQQANERREQILQAAKEQFALNGYHGTSIRMINKQVGVTDGLLYHYFPGGKQEMLETIFCEAKEVRMQTMDRLIASIKPDIPIETGLIHLLNGMVGILTGDREFLRIMFRDAESILSEQKNFMAEIIAQRRQVLVKILEERAEVGEINTLDDYEAAAFQILSIAMVLIMREVSFINVINVEAEEYIQQMVTFTVAQWRK